MSEFKTWRAFNHFEREVRGSRRFIRSKESEAFLRQVLETSHSRIRDVVSGSPFFRAQIGYDWERPNGLPERIPLSAERMIPQSDRAIEGRVNPKGMPCLYLSSTINAASSEVRPWIGSYVTVAEFETVRHLRIVDCSVRHESGLIYHPEELPPHQRELAVWARIDKAFARPVTRSDDTADYVATQIIAELFRTNGYDGIMYKSPFGDDGYTTALFDVAAAKCGERFLREVVAAEFYFEDEQD